MHYLKLIKVWSETSDLLETESHKPYESRLASYLKKILSSAICMKQSIFLVSFKEVESHKSVCDGHEFESCLGIKLTNKSWKLRTALVVPEDSLGLVTKLKVTGQS